MLRGIFDSPWQLVVVLLVVVVVFGSKRLPDAARGLGRSMRIFKSEVKQMQEESGPSKSAGPDGTPTGTTTTGADADARVGPEPLEGRIVEPHVTRTPTEQRHDS